MKQLNKADVLNHNVLEDSKVHIDTRINSKHAKPNIKNHKRRSRFFEVEDASRQVSSKAINFDVEEEPELEVATFLIV
ncbi:844_t:CDS:2 [Entrophospora sp. SA101]|nr:835_t:CDS:2 [Entrophospora sp. SA101]CAJ0848296.1 844_t:CDS:2 [Entrophospora sp. SA101]